MLKTSRYRGFKLTFRPEGSTDFQKIFKKILDNKDAFESINLAGDPNNGWTKRITVAGKFYFLKFEKKQNDKLENSIKTFFRGSHYERLIKRVAIAREQAFSGTYDVYLVAEKKILGCITESYIITEFLEGEALNKCPEWIESKSNKEKISVLFNEMHKHGLVSGDINPFNFIITKSGIKAIDLPGKRASKVEKAKDRIMLESRFGIKNDNNDFGCALAKLQMQLRNIFRFLRGKEISLWEFDSPGKPLPAESWEACGKWRALLAKGWENIPAEHLLNLAQGEPDTILQNGKEFVFTKTITIADTSKKLVIKKYNAPNFFQNLSARHIGSKTERAFKAAEILIQHDIETPAPVAVFERWNGKKIAESFLITEFVSEMSNFRDELNKIYSENPDCTTLMRLMQGVANACRAMHDSGVLHRDLGNQNIALKKRENSNVNWDIIFIDLDRVRLKKSVSDKERGKDLARLDLPSDFRRVFHSMYYQGYEPPFEFSEAEMTERKQFNRHSKLRSFRHPIREWKLRKAERAAVVRECIKPVPSGKDLWIWDEKSAQPIPPYISKERRKHHSIYNIVATMLGLIRHGIGVSQKYKRFLSHQQNINTNFDNKIGISLDANPETWDMQLHWLDKLEGEQKIPILLRIYHHKGEPQWDFAIKRSIELHYTGHPIAFALVQDRVAITNPKSWAKMLGIIFEATHNFADFYEIGHATNRSKWAIWDVREYAQLLHPAIIAKQKYPQIKLTGPACIDFDLHSLPAILEALPKNFKFDALSQHLYVDRRGAPENFQGKFDTLRKCAMLRAFAQEYNFKSDKIVVTEVNWPLLGVGEYSPIDSPFVIKGPWETRPDAPYTIEPPRVSEEDYANFMERYFKITLSSEHVSRVYWWRLSSRGFGLIDDSSARGRPRPAFFKLKKFLEETSSHESSDISKI